MVINLICHLALSQLQSQISHAHQAKIDRKCNNWERYLNLVVLLRVEDQEKQHNGQHVLEVHGGVNDEVPQAKAALVPICKDLIGVLHLVRNDLVEFAALKLHLFLVELVFYNVRASFSVACIVLITFLLVVDLGHGGGNALS